MIRHRWMIVAGLAACGETPVERTGVCAAARVGGEECSGFVSAGLIAPPDTFFDLPGTPSFDVGSPIDSCTCVAPSRAEACAIMGFPEGCPDSAEFAESLWGVGPDWATTELCTAQGGNEYAVKIPVSPFDHCSGVYHEPRTDLFAAVPRLYFDAGQIVAIEIVPPYGAHYEAVWCCNGTTTASRWFGPPLRISYCEDSPPLPCD